LETHATPPRHASTGKLRGVIFDMDGVLVMSEPILAQAAARMFAEKGFEVRHEEFHPFIGMGEDRYLGGVAEARGIPMDPERDKARTYTLYLELIKGRLEPLPGVLDAVRAVPRAQPRSGRGCAALRPGGL